MTALKMVETRSSLQREGVYRWFSVLSSAQRAEFLCGLLDLCVPIELRFLGSCLEDLARKDYHSLRDAEIKANNPADLANLTNITDEVVRSKLLISLALLSSDNREAAGVLFRTLTHIDTIINNYGLQLNDGQTGEQFLLLFTMASNHPAFSFHQKQVLRHELTQIQEILQLTGGEQQHATPLTQACSVPTCITAPSINSCHSGCACASKAVPHREVAMTPADESVTPDSLEVTPSAAQTQLELQVKGHSGKLNKVWVERVEIREVLQKPDKSTELLLQVVWSDSSQSCVSRCSQELKELLTQVSQLFPDECFEKFSPASSSHETSLELDPRWLSSLPPHVLKHDKVRHFFTSTPPTQLPNNTSLGCLLPFRGVSRAVCGVASIQPVMNVPHGPPLLQSALPPPPVPPQAMTMTTLASTGGAVPTECEGGVPPSPRLPHAGLGLAPQPQAQSKASANVPTHPQMPLPPLAHSYSQPPHPSHLQMQPQQHQHQQQQSNPEQNCLLDWLRKLRLHKYYPVFKQLTMEEFLALTEEDLNKYDLTQGAKKKLKTQLELQKEKRYVVSQFPVSCGGVARVTPSSHVSPLTHTHTSANTELRVEVETGSMPVPRDSSSSSGYSSAPNSPMTPQSRDGAFERAKDLHRRGEAVLDPSEKDRTVLMSPVMSGSRPTAQVLPVQNDPASSSLNLPPPMSHGRPLPSSRKPRPPPLCTDERRPTGMVGAARLESLFPSLSLEAGHPPGGSMLRSPPGLMVETSSALTATSNTLHRVSHPPLHLQLSPSLPTRGSGSGGHHYPFVLSSSSSASSSSSSSSSLSSSFSSKSSFPAAAAGGVPMATASSIPMVAVPGNSYCVNNVSALPPSSSPAPTEVACYGVSSSSYSAPPSSSSSSSSSCVCVCSSCGCSGNCGSYAALPTSYAGYFPHPFSGTSVFTLGPLLHLSPLLTGGAAAPGPFSYPVVAPPLYNNNLSHEAQQQQQQQGLVLPPMQGFLGGGGNLYQPHGIMGNGGNMKKGSGNVSCYNCGVSGHRAQDCKQPPMDSAQQGTFRLRYAPQPDSQDSGD